MSFENPQFNDPVSKEHKKEERTLADKLKNKVKKAITLGAIAVTAIGGEGCSKNEDAQKLPPKGPEPIVQKESGRMSKRYHGAEKFNLENARKVTDHEKQIMRGEINAQNIGQDPFLQGYYWYLEHKGDVTTNPEYQGSVMQSVEVGRAMRVLQIAFQKGINIDLSKGLNVNMPKSAGGVPMTAILNGVEVPISEADYTDRERELFQFSMGIQNSETKPVLKNSQSPAKGAGTIRQGPDFDKDADF